MLHSTCPSVGLNGTTTDVPRNLEELMKRCVLIKPKLDSYYFLQLGDNPFNKLFRGINQDIILTKYAHQSLYQPPPSTQTGFSSQMLRQDGTEEWDGVVPGTQNENPLPSIESPSKNTPVIIEEPQSLRYNRNMLLLINSDSEHSDGDTVGLHFTERQKSSQGIQECEDGIRESLTQAFTHNESFSNTEEPPPLLIRADEQNLSTVELSENQQTGDSDSFFASLDTILFKYTEQMQPQSQSNASPIVIQDETPLVSMGPSNSIQPSVIIESPIHINNTEDYSSEYEYSGSESDSDTLKTSTTETESQPTDTIGVFSQHSVNSNLITKENTTEYNAIYIENSTSPDFKPKRIKLMETIQTYRKEQQQNTQKLKTDVFKRPKPIQHKPWTKQEERLLVIGVSKYGKSWKRIHTALNFSPSRTIRALPKKYNILARNGKYSKYLREFRKNAGYKSDDQSEPEESDSDKDDRVNEQQAQTLALTHDRWTYQERENLVIGVERYGFNWKKIHSSFNFSPCRSHSSLNIKHNKMKKYGEYDQILLSYGKKVARGILPDSQTKLNYKVATDNKISSAIPGKTTANSSVFKATPDADRLTNPTKPIETRLHNKSLSQGTPKRNCKDEFSNCNDSNLNYWTRDEINNLLRGYEQYGNDWNTILKKYTFNPCRTVRSLSTKYKRISNMPGDSFYNNKKDPYFLPS